MENIVWKIKTQKDFYEAITEEYKTIFLSDDGYPNIPLKNSFVNYMSIDEKISSLGAIESGFTNLAFDDVRYYVNEYGARGDWSATHQEEDVVTIAFFGCSFTFGVGMDEEQIFQNLVGKNWSANGKKIEIINLGFPGGSISKSLRLYNYLIEVKKIDIAIFTLPTHLRHEWLVRDEENKVKYVNLIPNSKAHNMDDVWNLYYELMNDDNMLYQVTKDIMLIEAYAKPRNIKTFYSSWDNQTYGYVKKLLNDDTKMLPYFKFLENYGGKHLGHGRDGLHPGPTSHTNYAEEIMKHLDRYYLGKRDFI
jgi:hypothetical protein